jgi:hypothetical protein
VLLIDDTTLRNLVAADGLIISARVSVEAIPAMAPEIWTTDNSVLELRSSEDVVVEQ